MTDRSALGDYLKNLYQFDELTKDQEASLAKQIQAGDQAALDLLIKHNLRFVVSVVKDCLLYTSPSPRD